MALAKSVGDLMTSQSLEGRDCRDFEMLDAKIGHALRKIISSTSFRRVSVEEQRAQKKTADSCEGGTLCRIYSTFA